MIELYYYLVFCFVVAVFKTVYYIKVEEKGKFSLLSRKDLVKIIVLSMIVSFVLAPLTMVELVITIVNSKKRGGNTYE